MNPALIAQLIQLGVAVEPAIADLIKTIAGLHASHPALTPEQLSAFVLATSQAIQSREQSILALIAQERTAIQQKP